MQCPNDGATLLMSERQGVEIDYCPTCRGVWLDRGELDKILERTRAEEAEDRDEERTTRRPPPPPPPRRPDYDDRVEPRYDPRSDPRYRKRKKRSFLEDIFDFD